MTLSDGFFVVVLLALSAGMMQALRLLQQRRRAEPELVRKLFHIGGGLLGLTLPWLFTDMAPVILLALVLTGTFAALRLVPALKGGVGQVLHAIERRTIGEFCYVASLLMLFRLADGDKLLFSIPILILALADSFAAMVGEQYGRLRLRAPAEPKSYEGAAAFFLTAFLCVHIPVLLSGRVGRLESLLIGADVAVMVMMAEAAAWWGLDNLIIPVFSYMLLKTVLGKSAPVLASDIAFLLALALFMRLWRRQTPLADDALFGATLMGYVIYGVGGWQWSLAPLTQLVLYALLVRSAPAEGWKMHRFPVVLANAAGSLFWLLLYAQSGVEELILPFATCYGANITIIAVSRLGRHVPGIAWRDAVSVGAAKGMLVVLAPVLTLSGLTVGTLLNLAGCLIALWATGALFVRLQPDYATEPIGGLRWARQAVVVALTSTIALGVHYGSVPRLQLDGILP